MNDLIGLDEHTREQLQQLTTRLYESGQVVARSADELLDIFERVIAQSAEKVKDIADRFTVEVPNLPRSPAEIKRDIKHEKNPMRLKQLNKELNKAYKAHRRRNRP